MGGPRRVRCPRSRRHRGPLRQIGELWVRGPLLTQGYWSNAKTAKAITRESWLKTGDAAEVDGDVILYIADR
ncbi:4-coumarate--CoA ligase family protein [Kocuria salina]|nr:4-coumarate--CoA ligase family protein [Kocuria salina]